ncbi:MAG: hypothetical protein J5586_00950 [Clostridia bacterium]|nr:hypothetical protein [Clostridia bacterium]
MLIPALAALLCAVPASCRAPENAADPTGSVTVSVADGFTDAPIPGARVCVPETGGVFYTGADGATCEIRLPVIPDGEYEKLLPSGIGRATVVVTAEGYTPCLLLYVRIEPGVSRGPIPVLLFPDDGTLKTFSITESPPDWWTDALAEKYGG